MVKIKCKVMLCVLSYFILNFILVYSFDIENDHYIRKRYIGEQKGVCDGQSVSFNYNELYKKEGYTVTSVHKIFYLNICGIAPQCGGNIAVCYRNKLNPDRVNIGSLNDMFYPHEALRYKFGKRTKTKINFICDRHINEPNITYEEGSSYIFKFRTPRACTPKPTHCLFTGDKYTYNISSLGTIKNNWLVKTGQNVPNTNNNDYKIYLNICGKFNPFPNLETNSDCFYNGTQICLVYNNRSSKNLGVFSGSFQLKDDTSVSLSVIGGSLCNGSNTIATNIEFICSFDEFGPVLVSNSECEYQMTWMTPAVCPHQVFETSKTCELKTSIFGSRTMKFKMETIQLNTSILRYNICDPISCNGDENVHFCLVDINNNNTETIIGRSNSNKLISTDGLLTTTYYGDGCAAKKNRTKSRVHVIFNCDYTTNKRADFELSADKCRANITIHTNEACADPQPKILHESCSTFANYSDTMYYYNISRLMLTDRNYEIRDTANPSLIYILNVCQPILFRPGTNCDHTAIVCMRNDSVANIYQRSKTLGHYDSAKLTVLQNDSLWIQFEGSYCPFTKTNGNNYLASIEFICDYDAKDSQPTLVSNTDCDYYFKWETQYACPLTNDTKHKKTKNKNENNTNNFKVSYNIEEKKEQTQSYVSSTTTTTTTPTTTITSTTVATVPSPDEFVRKIQVITEPQENIVPTSLVVPVNVQVTNTSGLFIKNCTFEDFNMYTLPRNVNITSKTGKIYSLSICNLPKTPDCKLENCLSNLTRNMSKKYFEMDFHGISKCDDGYFNSVIYVKCSEESSQPSVIKEEACGVELEWKNSAVCASLQEKPKIHPNNDELSSQKSGYISTIIISVSVLLLILCSSVFVSIYFWRKRQTHNSPSCLNRCDYSRVKDSAKIV